MTSTPAPLNVDFIALHGCTVGEGRPAVDKLPSQFPNTGMALHRLNAKPRPKAFGFALFDQCQVFDEISDHC